MSVTLAGSGVAGVALASWLFRDRRMPWNPEMKPVGTKGGQLEGVDFLIGIVGDVAADAPLPLVVIVPGQNQVGQKQATEQLLQRLGDTPWPPTLKPFRFVVADGLWAAKATPPDHAEHLAGFIEELVVELPTVGKPVVGGFGEGAEVVYNLAANGPAESISQVVGAGGNFGNDIGVIRAPTTVIHGRNDVVVPYDAVASEVLDRVGSGQPMRLKPLTGVGHSFAGALGLAWARAVAAALQET